MKVVSIKSPKNLVYIDESGIDNTEDYALPKRREISCLKIWKENSTDQHDCSINKGKPMTFLMFLTVGLSSLYLYPFSYNSIDNKRK